MLQCMHIVRFALIWRVRREHRLKDQSTGLYPKRYTGFVTPDCTLVGVNAVTLNMYNLVPLCFYILKHISVPPVTKMFTLEKYCIF